MWNRMHHTYLWSWLVGCTCVFKLQLTWSWSYQKVRPKPNVVSGDKLTITDREAENKQMSKHKMDQNLVFKQNDDFI